MSRCEDAVTEDGEGVVLTIDVSANSKKDRFPAGYNAWRQALQCQIAAPPVEGKANKAIVRCIAAVLGVPRTRVAIASGATASIKRVRVTGVSRDDVLAVLEPLLPE
jgi:uncharacterized protein (TIGR00251 family)